MSIVAGAFCALLGVVVGAGLVLVTLAANARERDRRP